MFIKYSWVSETKVYKFVALEKITTSWFVLKLNVDNKYSNVNSLLVIRGLHVDSKYNYFMSVFSPSRLQFVNIPKKSHKTQNTFGKNVDFFTNYDSVCSLIKTQWYIVFPFISHNASQYVLFLNINVTQYLLS